MKKTIKGFVLGLIVSTMLMGTVFGVGAKEMIEVAFNSINLTVNEKKVEADNILYKGTTYVPLRAVGEMLGKDVVWNGDTNTASVDDKEAAEKVEKNKPKEESKITKPNTIKETKITNSTELKNYLQEKFGTLDTSIGNTNFDFKIRENTNSFTPEDYNINVEYEYDFFGGAIYSNKYTSQEKDKLRGELKNHMEKIGKAAIEAMPNKKLTGSYYDFYYKYPSINEGYTSTRYYTWTNYEDYRGMDAYEKTKPSTFRWYGFIDDKL